MFSGVETAYRSLIRAYSEDFFRKLISVHSTFMRDLRANFLFKQTKVNKINVCLTKLIKGVPPGIEPRDDSVTSKRLNNCAIIYF